MVFNGAFLSDDLLQFKPAGGTGANPTLAELQAINPDVCAWLTIDDTHIDYPVVIGEDDLEYVNKDVYGELCAVGVDLPGQRQRPRTSATRIRWCMATTWTMALCLATLWNL